MLRLRAPKASENSEARAAFASPATIEAEPQHETRAVSYPAIETYVAELAAGLRSVGSPELVAGTCEEVRQHLVATATALTELGESAEEAERHALSRFGGIGKHRRALTGELRRTARRTNPQAAFHFALALYGGVCAFDLLGATFFAIAPEVEGYRYLLDYWQRYVVFWLLLGSPLVTGGIVGRQTGRLAVRATCRAQLMIIGSLLFASGLAYVAVLGIYLLVMGEEVDPSHHWIVRLTFGLACYHVVRFPFSLASTWLARRPRRHSLPQAKG